MAQIYFDKKSKVWYRRLPDGKLEVIGNGAVVHSYNSSTGTTGYYTLNGNGTMSSSSQDRYNEYQAAMHPSSAKDVFKSWWNRTKDAFTFNPTFDNSSAVRQGLWKAGQEQALKRVIETPRDELETLSPYLAEFLKSSDSGVSFGEFSLSPEALLKYEEKWGEKNAAIKEKYGYDNYTIFLHRMLTDIYGTNAAKKLFPGSPLSNYTNWDLVLAPLLRVGDGKEVTYKDKDGNQVSGKERSSLDIVNIYAPDSKEVPESAKATNDLDGVWENKQLLGWVKTRDGKWYGQWGNKKHTKNGEEYWEDKIIDYNHSDDRISVELIRSVILLGLLEKYGALAGEYQKGPKFRNLNDEVGSSRIQKELSEKLLNSRDTYRTGTMLLNAVLNTDITSYLANNFDSVGNYDRSLGKRASDFMEAYGQYASKKRLLDLSEQERASALAAAEFLNSLAYANYKSHAGRMYGDLEEIKDPKKRQEVEDEILFDFFKHLAKVSYMGEDAVKKEMQEFFLNKENANYGGGVLGWGALTLASAGIGIAGTAAGLANFAYHYNPITIASIIASETFGDGSATDNIIKHSLDNSFINYVNDAETTGSLFNQDEKKYGKTYTNEELKRFLEAGVIDDETYRQAILENAEIAAGVRSANTASLTYGAGGTSLWGVVHQKTQEDASDAILNSGTVSEVIKVAAMMAGTKGMGELMAGGGAKLKEVGTGLRALGKMASNSSPLTTQLGGWGLKRLGGGARWFGTLNTELAPTVSALALDHGYAKSAYDLSLMLAELYIKSWDFNNTENAYISRYIRDPKYIYDDNGEPTGIDMVSSIDLNLVPLAYLDEARERYNEVLEFIRNKSKSYDEDEKALAKQYKDSGYTLENAVIEVIKNRLRNTYMQHAELAATTSAGITWLLTGAVDAVSFNTLNRAMYGVGAPKLAGAVEYLRQAPSKLARRAGLASAPSLFKSFSAAVGEGGAKVTAENVGRGFLTKYHFKNAASGFISNYNQDLGVGAGDKIYNGIMDIYVDNYFNKDNVQQVSNLSDLLSLSSMFALGELGAVEAASKIESIRDGLYGGFAGLLLSPRLDFKRRSRKRAEAEAKGTLRGIIRKAWDAIPISVDSGIKDIITGKNRLTEEINLERLMAANAIETFINSEKGRAFLQEKGQIEHWQKALDEARASGDILTKKNAEGHMILSLAFITAALEHTGYGLNVLSKMNNMALSRTYNEKDVEKLFEKAKRIKDAEAAGKKAEEFTEEERKINTFIQQIGETHATKDAKELALRLNNMSDNAKEFLQMVDDARTYMDKAAIVLGEHNNYIASLAYAEAMAYKQYLRRRYDKDIETYNKSLSDASDRLEKTIERSPEEVDHRVTSNILTNRFGKPSLAGIYRLIHGSKAKVTREIEDALLRLDDILEEYDEAYKDYREAEKQLKALEERDPEKSRSAKQLVKAMTLAQQYIRYLGRDKDRVKLLLSILKEAESIDDILKEDYSKGDITIGNSTIVPFIINALDILNLDPLAQSELISNYKSLSEELQRQIDLAAQHYANDESVSDELARNALYANANLIIKTKDLEKATKQEIEDALSNPRILSHRINDLAINQEELYFRKEFEDFANRSFSSYEDFYKAYTEKEGEIAAGDRPEGRMHGFKAALKNANIEYFQLMQDRREEVKALNNTLSYLDINGIQEEVLEDLKAVIGNIGVEHNTDFSSSQEVDGKIQKGYEVVANKLEQAINSLTIDKLNEILDLEVPMDQAAFDDRMSHFRDIILVYKKANEIQSKKDDFLNNDKGDGTEATGSVAPMKTEEEKRILNQLKLKEDIENKPIKEILTGLGIADTIADKLIGEGENSREDQIKSIINSILTNKDNEVTVPTALKPIVKALEQSIGTYALRVKREREAKAAAERHTPARVLFHGDSTSTDIDDQNMARVTEEYNTMLFLTGRHVRALQLSSGKIPIRLIAGKDVNTGLHLNSGNYYAVAVEVPNVVTRDNEDASRGRTITINGTNYLVIGFHRAEDIVDNNNSGLLHVVQGDGSNYSVKVALKTKTSIDESITEPLPISIKTRAEGGQPRMHFYITSAAKSADGIPHLRYYEGGASTMELLDDTGSDVIVREIADTTIEDKDSGEELTLATTSTPQTFNTFTLSFAKALKSFIYNNPRKENIVQNRSRLNDSANSKNADNSLTPDQMDAAAKKDGAAHFGLHTKLKFDLSLMPSIYLANKWSYDILEIKSGEKRYALAVKDGNTGKTYKLGEISREAWEDNDKEAIEEFVNTVLTNIGKNRSMSGEVLNTSMDLPVFKWNVSWSQFNLDVTDPHVQSSLAASIESYINLGILLYRPNKTELVHIAANDVSTEAQLAERAEKARKAKAEALKGADGAKIIEGLTLGIPDSVVDLGMLTLLRKKIERKVNNIVDKLLKYYESVTEGGGQFYTKEQRSKNKFYNQKDGEEGVRGLGYYFTRELIGRDLVTEEERASLANENSDYTSNIIGLGTDEFIREYTDHMESGNLSEFTYDAKGKYASLFTEDEFNFLKGRIDNVIKGLTTKKVGDREVKVPIKILGHNVIVGSKNKNFRELDLLLINEATGQLYNIDIKTYNADNIDPRVTSNWALNYHFNESNKGSQKNPETNKWEEMPLRTAYAIELVEQRRWLEHVLLQNGYNESNMPLIESYLMYIPITKTNNRKGQAIKSVPVKVQGEGGSVRTHKVKRILKQKGYNIFDARDASGNPIPIEIFRDIEAMKAAEIAAPIRMQAFLDRASNDTLNREEVSATSVNDVNRGRANILGEGGRIERTGEARSKLEKEVINKIKNASTMEELAVIMENVKKEGLSNNKKILEEYAKKVKELTKEALDKIPEKLEDRISIHGATGKLNSTIALGVEHHFGNEGMNNIDGRSEALKMGVNSENPIIFNDKGDKVYIAETTGLIETDEYGKSLGALLTGSDRGDIETVQFYRPLTKEEQEAVTKIIAEYRDQHKVTTWQEFAEALDAVIDNTAHIGIGAVNFSEFRSLNGTVIPTDPGVKIKKGDEVLTVVEYKKEGEDNVLYFNNDKGERVKYTSLEIYKWDDVSLIPNKPKRYSVNLDAITQEKAIELLGLEAISGEEHIEISSVQSNALATADYLNEEIGAEQYSKHLGILISNVDEYIEKYKSVLIDSENNPPRESNKKRRKVTGRKGGAVNPRISGLGVIASIYSFAMTLGGDLLNQISDALADLLLHCM